MYPSQTESLVLTMGLPGTGKSYFASRLAEHIGAAYINSDNVRWQMNARGRYAIEDKLRVYRQMAAMADVALEQSRCVVIDATFHKKEMRDIFISLARQKRVPIAFVAVTAPETIVQKRLEQPRGDSEADFAVYQQLKLQRDPLDEPHLSLPSLQHNVAWMVDDAIRYLNSELKEQKMHDYR